MIEAPGKRKRFQDALRWMPKQWSGEIVVLATGGHFMESPPIGTPAIRPDGSLVRFPKKGDRIVKLTEHLSRAVEVVVATDPDDEGEVIGADIAALSVKGTLVTRAIVHSMDVESIRRGIEERIPWENKSARGIARATIDRLILEKFGERGLSIGRVVSPVLELTGKESIWKTLSTKPDVTAPWNLSDLLCIKSEQTVLEKNRLSENLYLAGKVSYPRTDSRSFSEDVSRTIKNWISRLSIAQEAETLLRSFESERDSAHNALYAMGKIGWDDNLYNASSSTAMHVQVARSSIAGAGGNPEKQWGKFEWSSSPDAKLVRLQESHRLGRPSTWASRADNLISRDLVNERGLTPNGRFSLERAPVFLRDEKTCVGIEDLITEKSRDRWTSAEIVTEATRQFDFIRLPSEWPKETASKDLPSAGTPSF